MRSGNRLKRPATRASYNMSLRCNLTRVVFYCAIVVMISSCESVTKSTVAVSSGVERLDPVVYAVVPFGTEATPKNQSYPKVRGEAQRVLTTMFVARLVEVVPVVVDRSNVAAVLTEIEFQNLTGLTNHDAATRLGNMINADAIVTGTITDYNASNVGLSVTAIHVTTGAVLWSGDVTTRVGWISLDIESAAERAVDRLFRELRRDLS